MPRKALLLTLLIVAVSWPLRAAQAIQPGVPGFAEITDPSPDQPLTGLYTIRGTAFHPDFSSYELFFSFDPNPTGTWFPLSGQIETAVQEDGLALWDTSEITAGTYQLRLLVHSNQGQTVEAVVEGLRVGSELSSEAGETEPQLAEQPVAEEPSSEQPELASESQVETSQPITPEQTLLRLLLTGAVTAAAILLSFGAYTLLRPRVRDYLGLLRIRQRHRTDKRSNRRGQNRQ